MAAISETLRQARLRSGVDLDKLAAKTKINHRYLEAIEQGDFDKLPSGIFARMFIKQYADAVGLDGASFAEEFQRSSQFGNPSSLDMGTIVEARTNFHPSVPSLSAVGGRGLNERLTSALSSLIWVVAIILVCAGVYYGLTHLPSRSAPSRPAEAVTPAVAKPVPPLQQPPTESAPKTPETSSVASGARPEMPSPGSPRDTATPQQNTVPQQIAPPKTAPVVTAGPTPAPQGSAPIQLTLTANQEVWVTATADGKMVMAENMQPGSRRIVTASQGVRLHLGNAGGADITFNGKKLEPFGANGEVRTVDFTSWGAQVVSRTLPNPDPLR